MEEPLTSTVERLRDSLSVTGQLITSRTSSGGNLLPHYHLSSHRLATSPQ
jgi:hypothetical protein